MLPKKGQKFPGGNDRDGRRAAYAGIVAAALATELGATHRAAKILMGWTGAGERTVKHWLAGAHGPGGGHLLVLMRESDEVFGAVAAACGRGDRAAAARTSGEPVRATDPEWGGPLTRAPASRRRDRSPVRARMTVIMTVFVTVMMTVMMTVIRPTAGRVSQARAISGGRGFSTRWRPAGASRPPISWSAGASPRKRAAATSRSSRPAV